jgi:RND family efflux transporter MFP subunit
LLRLILPVPESAVPTVHVGQQVQVRVPTLNRTFPGRVARFADKVAMATRTMDTEVDVPNPNMVLVPGMFAEVNLTLEQRENVLAVPILAVDLGDNSSGRVWVVKSDNHTEERAIETGLQSSNAVEIRSGLQPGEMVVTSNRSSLRSGELVRPKQVEFGQEASR